MSRDPMSIITAREICDEARRGLQRSLNLLAKGDPDRERPELHNRVEQLLHDLDALDAEFQR